MTGAAEMVTWLIHGPAFNLAALAFRGEPVKNAELVRDSRTGVVAVSTRMEGSYSEA